MKRLALPLLLNGCVVGWESQPAPASDVPGFEVGPGAGEQSTCDAYACPEPTASFGDDSSMVVGTGEKCFEPIDDGGVAIYQGPQGGFHVFVAMRCRDVGPNVLLQHAIRDADTGEIYSIADPIERKVELCDVGGGWDERARMYNYLDVWDGAAAAALVGKRVLIEATLYDDAGHSASDVTETTLRELVWWLDPQI